MKVRPMRSAQVIDFEYYRSRRREAEVREDAQTMNVPAPVLTTVPVVWVPVWWWLPLGGHLG